MRQRVVLFAAQTDVIGRPAALGFYRAAHFVFLGGIHMLLQVERFFMQTSRLLGRALALVFLLMTVNVFFDVVMR